MGKTIKNYIILKNIKENNEDLNIFIKNKRNKIKDYLLNFFGFYSNNPIFFFV